MSTKERDSLYMLRHTPRVLWDAAVCNGCQWRSLYTVRKKEENDLKCPNTTCTRTQATTHPLQDVPNFGVEVGWDPV